MIVIDAEMFGQLATLHSIDFRTCLDRMLIVAIVSVKHSSVIYKNDWLGIGNYKFRSIVDAMNFCENRKKTVFTLAMENPK